MTPEVFHELVERHGDRLHDHLVRRVGVVAAEDASCDLWEAAFVRRRSFDPERGTVLAWLYGIARNLVAEVFRRRERDSRVWPRALLFVSSSLSAPVDETAISAVDSERMLAPVLEALSRLDASDREILELWAWDELSYAELATILGVAVGTVRSRISRARGRLAAEAGMRWTS